MRSPHLHPVSVQNREHENDCFKKQDVRAVSAEPELKKAKRAEEIDAGRIEEHVERMDDT